MPETIGALIISTLISAEAAAATFTVLGVTISYAAIVGATVLAAAELALSSALLPSVPASDGQLTIQQPVPYRRRGYGRMKLGGYYVFWTSVSGALYSLIAILAHEIDGYEEWWLSDRRVSLDGSGNVTGVTAPAGANPTQFNPGGGHPVQLHYNTGAAGKTAYASLVAAFPTVWTSAHIGVGIADALLIEGGVSQNDFSQVYPGGEQGMRAVLRGAKIYDPRVGGEDPNDPTTWAYSDNAAAVLLDYLTHPDGWRVAKSMFLSGMAEAVTLQAFADADQPINLKSGGTEPRYRLWGYYDFDEEPRQVLARMLAACGGWLQPFPDGTIGIRMGVWVEPDFTITDDMIIGFEVQHFVGEFDAINEIRATFNDPTNDYQNTESTPWDNDADIAQRGYTKSTSIDARHCPSYTQTRRIQKVAANEAMPEWTISLTLSLEALGARNRKFVNLVMNQLGISPACRVTGFTTNTQSQTCSVQLASFPATSYDWDPNTEEGPSPAAPTDSSSMGTVESPSNLTVVVETRNITGGSTGPVMVISCDPPSDRSDLTVKFEYQLAGQDRWSVVSQGTQTFETETAILADGTYNVRASFFTSSTVQSAFATVSGIVVAVTTAAPGSPSGLTATPTTGATVDLAAVASNSAQMYAGRFYRSAINVFSGATDISGRVYATANQPYGFTDNVPTGGTWYYWSTAENSSGNKSSPAGSVSVHV